MEKINTIATGGLGLLTSVVAEDYVGPQLDMSQWASAFTQLLIAVITVVGLFKKKKN